MTFFAFSLLQLPNKTYFHSTTHYVWVKNEKVRIMSNAQWLVGPFPFLFHFHFQIFQYQRITHGLWFIQEKKAKIIMQNFNLWMARILSNYRNVEPKMYHVGHFCSPFRYFDKFKSVRILSNYQNECISGHMTNPPSNGFCQISLTAPYKKSNNLLLLIFSLIFI